MSRSTIILAALVAGLLAGTILSAVQMPLTENIISIAEPVGRLWLGALRMTLVPLVFALVVMGIASAASTAATGGLAARALAIFALLLVVAASIAAIMTPALLALSPPPEQAIETLRAAGHGRAEVPALPPPAEWIVGLIPDNPVRAAADGAMLQLVLFALVFGFAATRIPQERRIALVELFQSVADTMMVIIGWVLWIASIGVFALALSVGATSGFAAAGALAHYIAIVSAVCLAIMMLAYPIARLVGRVPLGRFARALAPAQAVAASTQSSLASLPAMIEGAERGLGIPGRVAGLVLPLAVSLFRMTSPAGNLAVAIYLAHLYNVPVGPMQLVAAVLVAAIVSLAVVGVASQVSFFAGAAPVCIAIGAPIEPLALLIAVESIPDIFRTVGNVSADLAVTSVLARSDAETMAKHGRAGALDEATPAGPSHLSTM
ncbi:dicarboxylate/amino acid:cation symporter [Sphingomonas oleivorans]|uniref:Dicarboxylate/amino acid:cation symporter n=1 Tax=Sphingomonas oleivorans TaxID=1735121 RepID=A0A2T5G1T7_9SPHN|nr:cation:dicarboxylase symporter family transporter [Sphingomonas oleivorans]PTQ13117.1 dicarboxylate/amino acid:cation symporter [Sphingomonas oleivorans]